MTTVKDKRGRPNDKSFLSYEKAREKVQKERIGSRREYAIWVNARNRKSMPKHPSVVYSSEWTGWNVFLGNDNSFTNRIKKHYKSFEDSLLYARKLKISSFENWCQVRHPDDIPVRADIVYKIQWKGWKYFLGTGKYSATAVVETVRKKERDLIWIVSSHRYGPENVLNVRAFNDKDKVLAYLSKNDLTFVRAFKNHPDVNVFEVLEKHGTPYGHDDWLIENLNDAIFDISLRCV